LSLSNSYLWFLASFNLISIQSWERKSISWFVSALSLCSSFSCSVAAFTWQVDPPKHYVTRLALWHRSMFISLYLIGCCKCACLQYFNCLNSQETGIVFCQGDWKGVGAHTNDEQLVTPWTHFALCSYLSSCFLFVTCVHPGGWRLDAQGNDSKVPVKLKTFVELTVVSFPFCYFFEARILYGNGDFPVSLGTPFNGSSSGVQCRL
jgi:hypothetical protein